MCRKPNKKLSVSQSKFRRDLLTSFYVSKCPLDKTQVICKVIARDYPLVNWLDQSVLVYAGDELSGHRFYFDSESFKYPTSLTKVKGPLFFLSLFGLLYYIPKSVWQSTIPQTLGLFFGKVCNCGSQDLQCDVFTVLIFHFCSLFDKLCSPPHVLQVFFHRYLVSRYELQSHP